MARERVFVSIGEAFLIERSGEVQAGGLAIAYSRAASAEPNCRGMAVSRVGQDAQGGELLRLARGQAISIEHVQTDPDLPTGRLITRSIAGRPSTTLTANAAFDNLQWDFDLVDLAQRAEAVFFGQFARRGGQTKSVIKQFLHECGSGGVGAALRVFDLTNRVSDAVERSEAWSGLDFCEVLVTDERGLSALAPPSAGDAAAAAKELFRGTALQVIVTCAKQGERERVRAITRSEASEAGEAFDGANHERAIVRMIAALIDGQSLGASVRSASS